MVNAEKLGRFGRIDGIVVLYSALLLISGAVYDLSKSYDQVFVVIGGVYVVAAVVFGAAAMLQAVHSAEPRHQTRRSTGFTSPARVDIRAAAGTTSFQPFADFHLTPPSVVNSTPIVTAAPPLFSTYGAVIGTNAGGARAGQNVIGQNGKADIGKRREQAATTTSAPSAE